MNYPIVLTFIECLWVRSLFLNSMHDSNISTVLHPSYKTAYFARLNCDEEWVDEALWITHESWNRYKPSGHVGGSASRTTNPSVSHCLWPKVNSSNICCRFLQLRNPLIPFRYTSMHKFPWQILMLMWMNWSAT